MRNMMAGRERGGGEFACGYGKTRITVTRTEKQVPRLRSPRRPSLGMTTPYISLITQVKPLSSMPQKHVIQDPCDGN
jgi:hypothetical protein